MGIEPSLLRHITRPEIAFHDECPVEWQHANLAQHNLDEVREQAAAEWAAMDAEGRLPEGWTFTPKGLTDGTE